MLMVYVDADGCPVKDEVLRVTQRYDLSVRFVANRYVAVDGAPRVQSIVVSESFDAADDWIVEQAERGDIVVTADIPLAARCLEKGVRVLGHKGRELTEDSIGNALASRELSQQLRDMGMNTGGPAPMQKKDRSKFLQRLDEVINAIRRES